ncbi:hypothetical protein K431DRAFT_322022 [Polychaeton citri CBS 116435]|uniref:CHY-type domain-containing protein n=1 Tax=Polychaeton citri CBS 116435 TaxID=1314669 RepID=A0A9P4Q5S8_9PEZI|nr:hypothetical protein K431DRAFT_322022 [Polychaeton citri CBS 116435]
MCKHILNQQVSIRAPCCKRWFDCAECHAEITEKEASLDQNKIHNIPPREEMELGCKKCKKVFRIRPAEFDEEADGFCPRCDNQFYVEAKTPRAELKVESDDVRVDARMLKDQRMKQMKELWDLDVWDDEGEAARLG